MSDDSADPGLSDATQAFLGHLESAGFFQQLSELERNLKSIATELQVQGESAAERGRESENLAAHILAVESVLAALLEKYPLDAQDISDAVTQRTAAMSGIAEGSPLVHSIAKGMLSEADS